MTEVSHILQSPKADMLTQVESSRYECVERCEYIYEKG